MKIKTWNAHNINDGLVYKATFTPNAYGLAAVNVAMIPKYGRFPEFGGISRPERTLGIDIMVLSTSATAVETYTDQLVGWFDPDDETPKVLVIEDDATGNDRYVYAVCQALDSAGTIKRRMYHVTLKVDGDVLWRKVTASTDSWNITATGQTKVMANGGEAAAYPIFTITPTSAKTGGYAYKRWAPVRWRISTPFTRYPYDICDNAFDTDALVSGGKMQADGDDLRVIVDGVEVDRWLDGINTTTTKVWVNLDFAAKGEATLKTACASSGAIATLEVNEDISAFPSAGILLVEDEAFIYTGKNNAQMRFTGCTRTAKGTAAAAHAVAAAVWWVQHDIWILYGNATATAPTTVATYKPVFDLDTSTNTSWVYTTFRDGAGLRAGSWIHQDREAPTQRPSFYGGAHGTTADPYVVMGMAILCTASAPYGSSGRNFMYNPCGITNLNFVSMEKYQADVSNYWVAEIKSSPLALAWGLEYTIAEPAAASWTADNQNEALTAGSVYAGVYLAAYGYMGKAASDYAYVEFSAATATLDSNYTPTITLGAEQGNYSLNCKITNNTTGKSISIDFTMELDQALVVNIDLKTVTYSKDGSNQFNVLTVDGGTRRDWLTFSPGNNTIQFDDTGTAAVTLATSWEERSYN